MSSMSGPTTAMAILRLNAATSSATRTRCPDAEPMRGPGALATSAALGGDVCIHRGFVGIGSPINPLDYPLQALSPG